MKDDKEEPKILYRREVKDPAAKHQPRKAEVKEEFDMPGASLEAVRRAFFRAFRPRRSRAK